MHQDTQRPIAARPSLSGSGSGRGRPIDGSQPGAALHRRDGVRAKPAGVSADTGQDLRTMRRVIIGARQESRQHVLQDVAESEVCRCGSRMKLDVLKSSGSSSVYLSDVI